MTLQPRSVARKFPQPSCKTFVEKPFIDQFPLGDVLPGTLDGGFAVRPE